MKEPDAPSEATIIRETVTYGIDGRCSITFTEPAKPVVVEAPKLSRWRTNHLRRRSAGFIDREGLNKKKHRWRPKSSGAKNSTNICEELHIKLKSTVPDRIQL
jgi:hypothetical protein